jgi:hypothetical protein
MQSRKKWHKTSLMLLAIMFLMVVFQSPVESFAQAEKKNVAEQNANAAAQRDKVAGAITTALGGIAFGSALVYASGMGIGPFVVTLIGGFLAYKGLRKLFKSDKTDAEDLNKNTGETESYARKTVNTYKSETPETDMEKSLDRQKLLQQYYDATNRGDKEVMEEISIKLKTAQ